MEIERVKTKRPANFPFVVQHLNTENWNTAAAYLSEDDAVKHAERIAEKYPYMRVRVEHCAGGPMV